MYIGLESIRSDQDTKFILRATKIVDNIFNTLRLQLSDLIASNNESKTNIKDYDKYKRSLKVTILEKDLNELNKLLSTRFGIDIHIENVSTNLTDVAKLIIPSFNNRLINMAMNDLDSLFPKKKINGILWETMASKKEKALYNILKDVSEAVSTGRLKIDLDEAYISGLDYSKFVININFLSMATLGLSSREAMAIILHEVGHIFAYLEYMFITSKNIIHLLDTFRYERFVKNKPPMKALVYSIESSELDIDVGKQDTVAVLHALEMYILKTYRLDPTRGSIKIDYERMADIFSTRMGLGDALASALIKVSSSGTIQPKNNGYKVADITHTVFMFMIEISMIVISLILFSVIGVIITALYIGYKVLGLLINLLLMFITKLFKIFFSDNVDKDVTYDNLLKRINKIRLDLIRQLRSINTGEYGKQLLIEQIDDVKNYMNLIKDKLSILGKYGDTNMVISSYDDFAILLDLIEHTQENELHLLGNKLKYMER